MNAEDIRKYLIWLGIGVFKRSNDDWMCICPFHKGGHEKHPSMGINDEGVFNCFTCGAKGNLVHLTAGLLGIGQGEAIRVIEQHNLEGIKDAESIKIPLWEERYGIKKDGFLSEDVLELYRGREIVRNTYMMRRGIKLSTMNFWGIGYDRWTNRITFPIRDFENNLIGISGRTLEQDVEPKYYFYDGCKKGGYLFGEQFRGHIKELYVVEGFVDALWLWQNDFNVVSIMGSKMSEKQADLICRRSSNVVLWLDNDPAGFSGLKTAIYYLKDRIKKLYEIDWRSLGKEGDPADLTVEELKTVGKHKVHYLERRVVGALSYNERGK